MPDIGSFGKLVFEVSGVRVRSFSEIKETTEARWHEHEPINTAPLSEFLGPGLDSFEMKIIFTTMLGSDPVADYETIRQHVRNGEHFPLIIDGMPMSQNDWYLTHVEKTTTVFEPGTGYPLWCECVIQGREYN